MDTLESLQEELHLAAQVGNSLLLENQKLRKELEDARRIVHANQEDTWNAAIPTKSEQQQAIRENERDVKTREEMRNEKEEWERKCMQHQEELKHAKGTRNHSLLPDTLC